MNAPTYTSNTRWRHFVYLIAALTVTVTICLVSLIEHGSSGSVISAVANCEMVNLKPNVQSSECANAGQGGGMSAKQNASFSPIAVPQVQSSIPAFGSITSEFSQPFSSMDFSTNTEWFNEANGNYFHVYAGALGSDSEQGVVVVVVEPMADSSSNSITLTSYPSSSVDGPLTITGFQGWTITLLSSDGDTYYFDVSTLSYVASPS
jgi:hypothetical protein